eukprot:51337-Amphidinium_carterae.3
MVEAAAINAFDSGAVPLRDAHLRCIRQLTAHVPSTGFANGQDVILLCDLALVPTLHFLTLL